MQGYLSQNVCGTEYSEDIDQNPSHHGILYGSSLLAKVRAYADSEGLDQPAHPRSPIKAFAVR